MRQNSLGDLRGHALVPAREPLLVKHGPKHIKRSLVGSVLGLKTDLGKNRYHLEREFLCGEYARVGMDTQLRHHPLQLHVRRGVFLKYRKVLKTRQEQT